MLRYLQQIESRIADAEARVTRCQQSLVARLSKELAKVKAALAKKSVQLREQQQLNHRLLGRLRELERAMECGAPPAERDSHNSSLPPSTDPPWKKVKRTKSLRKKTGRSVGGQVGHPGATLRQTAHPDHLVIHTPEACRQCGASLDHGQPQGIIRRQVFDIEDGRVKVTEHRSTTQRCQECGAMNRAAFPASVRAPVQYGGGVLARKERALSAVSEAISRPLASRDTHCSIRWREPSLASRFPVKYQHLLRFQNQGGVRVDVKMLRPCSREDHI